jgi:tetratricopeptide (TPR) repeat protein
VGFFTSLFGFQSENEDSRKEAIVKDFHQAIEAREMNEVERAEAEFEKIERISKEISGFFDEEKYEQALDYINSELEKTDVDYFLFGQKSSILSFMERYEEAFEVLDDAIGRFPEDRFLHYESKAEILTKLENYAGAIDCLCKAIDIRIAKKETDTFFFRNAYSNRGNAYFKLGNYQLALADYDKAIELDPETSYLYSRRSNAHLALKNYHQALSDINQCLKLGGEKAGSFPYLDRGKIYAEMGNNDNAIEDYTTAITLSQTEEFGIWGHFERGEIYLLTGNYNLALEDFSEIIKMDPEWSEGYQKRAEVYQRLGQDSLAAADLEKADLIMTEEFENQ